MLSTLGSSDWLGEKFGTGPVDIIALHGWGRTAADFGAILAGTNGMALHLPGFGQAPAPDTAWSTSDYADHIAKALEGLPPVVVLGHSFGGRVALRLAARHPDRVRALVLTGVPLVRATPARAPAPAFRLAKFLHRFRLISDATMETFRQKYGSTDYRSASGVMRDILVRTVAEDYADDAATISQPVTLVWGELDRPAPLAGAQKFLDYFPNATLRVVRGASHLLEGSLEEDVATAVSETLKL